MSRSEVPKRELIGQRQSPGGRDRLPPGGLEFFALLARLLRRPRRGDRRLPLLWLVRTDTQVRSDTKVGSDTLGRSDTLVGSDTKVGSDTLGRSDTLVGSDTKVGSDTLGRSDASDLMVPLRRFLGQGPRRRVPHAVLDADVPPGAGDVPALLRELHRQLSLEAFGAARLRFRHYPLADWLMHQSLTFGVDADDSRAALVRRLRDRRGPRTPEAMPSGGDAVSIVSQVLLWLVRRAVPSVVFRAAVSGRVPVLGRHYTWFMRQQYLAPRQSVTFLGFAERLTAGWRDGEQPDQVNKLLLHAFLEDLRQAYRRRPWRPSDWRRTAYPALLLDHVAPGNVGGELVRLIGDVRTETGRNDPLLIVVSGGQPPPELPEPHPLTEADEAYDEWAEALPEMRRLRRPAAWLVALRPDDTDTGPPSRGGMRPFSAPDPPWWSRRFLPAALSLVLLAAGGVWVGSRWGPGCHPSLTGGRITVEVTGSGECVGYSDSAAQVFNNDPGQDGLRKIQRRIFAQNRAAEEVWQRSDRRRPFLTLVYLGTLTGNRTRADEESYVSEREELEGMATAQYALLKESAGADGAALLRIVVANGGRQMSYADRAVEMLAELARDDPTVLGVVGLVESRTSTARALRELNRVGLPVLAPTLSADKMDANSRLYLQISAPNADQVKLVDTYAQQVLKVDQAHVYYTTLEGSSLSEDLYVNTLVDGLRQRFGTRITHLDKWSTGQRLTDECGYPGLLFYAGRWSEFDGFLRALRECGANPPRHLVADDSANRYMANPGLRAAAPGNLPVTYVSKAALATCAALRAAAQDRRDDARASFLSWIQADDLLDQPRCRPGSERQVGERVSLSYDASMMLIRAVESLAARLHHADPRQRWEPTSVNPVGVHAEVLRQNAGQGYPGVAGLIRFTPESGEPVDKRLALMRVEQVPDVATAPVEVFHCGVADASTPAACGPA